MLIVCNGVFKSGSSWLHAIILEILRKNNISVDKVPYKYTNNIKSPTTIIESKLFEFLANEDYRAKNYITKSHYYLSKTMQRQYDEKIYFFFVERDVRDAIVSHYHHIKKKYSFLRGLGFDSYYLFLGKLKAFEILNFNRRYRSNFTKENFFRYIDMKNDFESVVIKISHILGLRSLTLEEINTIKTATSIENMRKKLLLGKSKYYSTVAKDRFSLIRKGQVGDWINYLNKSQADEIDMIEKNKNVFFLKIFYFFLFTCRRQLFHIE